MDTVFDLQSFSTNRCGDDRHAVSEGLEDLQAGTAAVTNGDDNDVGAGQLGLHRRHGAHYRYRWWAVVSLHPRHGLAHKSDFEIGEKGPEPRRDLGHQPVGRIHVRGIVEGGLEEGDGGFLTSMRPTARSGRSYVLGTTTALVRPERRRSRSLERTTRSTDAGHRALELSASPGRSIGPEPPP